MRFVFLLFFLHFIVFDCCFCFDFGAKNSHAWLECCYVRMFVWNVGDFVKNKNQMICEQSKWNVICFCITLNDIVMCRNFEFKITKLSQSAQNCLQGHQTLVKLNPLEIALGIQNWLLTQSVCVYLCCFGYFIVFNGVESNCCEYARCTVRFFCCWQIVQTKQCMQVAVALVFS